MTFAVPLFLIASLAAAIPVVLHMIHRQKAQQLPFSTLRFLRLSVEKTRRRKRIHDVLLMVLRAAVLLLLAVGLARPTLTSLSSLWGRADTAVAIILDNSASMGMVDQGQVRFRTALGAAEQIVGQLREGDQVALLLSGGPVLPELGKLDRTQEQVRQMLLQWLNAPSPTGGVSYERADLGVKIQQARTLLAESEAASKQIYVLTDLQRLSWESTAGGPEHTLSLRERAGVRASQAGDDTQSPHPNPLPKGEGTDGEALPKGEGEGNEIPIILVDCNRAPAPNVAVAGVSLATAVPVAGLPVKATAELFNAAPDAQQRRLELYVDGAKEESSPVLNVPPGGRLTHEFTFTPTRGGLHRGEVRLVGEDGSTLDDRRFFAVEVDQGIPVAVVKPQRHEIPYLEDTFYVEQALAPGKSGGWAIRPTPLAAGDLLGEPLSDYKVVFCVNLPAPPSDTAERLRAYVAGGGNLVWICGDNVEPVAYNQMDQQAAGQLLPAPLLDIRTAGASRGLSQFSRSENGTVPLVSQFSRSENGTVPLAPLADADRDSWQISFLDREHPALRPLAEPAALYQSVLVYKHVRMDTKGTSGVWVLARLDDGEPLLAQRDVGRGKVLFLGTSAHVGWSNLPLRPIFLPLLVQLTYHLAGVEQARHMLLAGSPIMLPLEGATRPSGIEILPPGGELIRRKTEDEQEQPLKMFRYDDTHQVGIYELRLLGRTTLWEATPSATGPSSGFPSATESPPTVGGAKQIGFAVNVDPDEADPAKIEPEELRERFAPTPLVFADNPDDLSSTFAWLREGTSLWEWFLAAVLIALVFEPLLANRLSPKQEETGAERPHPGTRRLAEKGAGVRIAASYLPHNE